MSPSRPRRAASAVAATAALCLLGAAPATAHQSHGAGHGGHSTEHRSHGHGHPKRIDYVNLGDSYSAAIGTGGIVASSLGPECRQGDGPDHVSALDELSRVHLLVDGACAGATTDQVQEIASRQPVRTALRRAELVTLTLGGNDVGWIDIIRACSRQGTDAACDVAVGAAPARIDAAAESAGETVAAIDAGTRGQVVVLGYPRLFSADERSPLISPERAEQLNDLTDDLNDALEEAVEADDAAQFVDVTEYFEGHAADSLEPWIYFNPSDPADPNNLHPTATGYLAGYYAAFTAEVELDLRHRGR